MDSNPSTFVETRYLNTDMGKLESSHEKGSRAQSVNSSKVYFKPRTLNCF